MTETILYVATVLPVVGMFFSIARAVVLHVERMTKERAAATAEKLARQYRMSVEDMKFDAELAAMVEDARIAALPFDVRCRMLEQALWEQGSLHVGTRIKYSGYNY